MPDKYLAMFFAAACLIQHAFLLAEMDRRQEVEAQIEILKLGNETLKGIMEEE